MWEAFGISDQGCVRQNNEDTFAIAAKGLYVLADGMGGAQAGERASRIAVDAVTTMVGEQADADLIVLNRAFQEANRQVMEAASEDIQLEGMGTTLIAALVVRDELVLASVGDSRAYIHDGNTLLEVTEDQTWVNEVGRKLGMDEASLKVHPMRHMLTMAIGLSPKLRIHSYALQPRPGTEVLLCSDGLHGPVSRDRIAEVLSRQATLEEKAAALILAAKDAGGPDNVTVVLLRYKA
jgi:protein phosphatase